MRYWFDTEFHEDGHEIDLISLGMVAEDGRELYVEVAGFDYSKVNEWVRANVLPHLWSRQPEKREGNIWIRGGGRGGLLSRQHIARELEAFCDPATYGKPEVWAYYADYDWVVLCQLFGRMIDLPDGWPMYCRDLKQEADRLQEWIRGFNSAPEYKLILPKQESDEHHALADARWNRQAWEFLGSISGLPA